MPGKCSVENSAMERSGKAIPYSSLGSAKLSVSSLKRPRQYFGRLFWYATATITTQPDSTAYNRLYGK
jgi:hypothetical protein